MRAVIDTNILLSALINPHGLPAKLVDAWRSQRYTLITSGEQLIELGQVAQRNALRKYVVPARVGAFINDLRELAEVLVRLPKIDRLTDPADNYLLAMAEGGRADYLASGDKRHVLTLKRFGATHIVTARELVVVLNLE
jgi:uncharacterized protein